MPATKPVELLELNGAFKLNPQRRRPVGPKSENGLGEPPLTLSEAEASCWREIESNAARNVLTSSERVTVEVAAILLAKLRREGLTAAEITQLLKTQSSLGMTAVDRSKVVAGEQEQESPYSEFSR